MRVKKNSCSMVIMAPQVELFNHLFCSNVFPAYNRFWLIPRFTYAVEGCRDERPGSKLTIYFEDANTARIKFIRYFQQLFFALKIDSFSSYLSVGLSDLIYK